jgi:16S rRNA (cytosine967-C5)-methyltransferase
VHAGAYADRAFAGEASRANLTPQVRGQAHRLIFGVVQRRRTLDWLIDEKVTNPAALEPMVRDVLRIATYELGWSDSVPTPVAVDQAVLLAAGLPGDGKRRSARRGLVNAVARAIARDIRERLDGLTDATWQGAAIQHSTPDWIARRLFETLGHDEATATLAALNAPAESIVRWNALGGSRIDFEAALPGGWHRCEAPFDDAYRLNGAFALEDSVIWREGRGMAQSRASMLPVLAVGALPGERVLDLCAAPGAKATALAAAVGPYGKVVAVEPHPGRARGLRVLAERLHTQMEVVEGDGRDVALPNEQFDAVLVDPPCSGLGVLGSRPDARWRRQESDLAELVALQRALLERALSVVAAGGRVVYSTCTLLAQENEGVVGAVGAVVDPIDALAPQFAHPHLPGALRTLPGRDGTDGFFVARLRPDTSR